VSTAPSAWTPSDWVCAGFPLVHPGEEIVTMDALVAALQAWVDTATEEDTTAICAVLHVAHRFKIYQGADGRWPDTLNLRTGWPVGEGRTLAPLALLLRLNDLLNSAEFDDVCALAETAGDFASTIERGK